MTENEIGTAIIASAMKVHSAVGPGLLESAHEACLLYELERQGVPVHRQVLIPIQYENLKIDNGYRIDLLVGDCVVVELKGGRGDLACASRPTAELSATRPVQARLFVKF